MALGELIEEAKGVITGQRVLEIEGPKNWRGNLEEWIQM
jgi:hypothetical protein